MRNSSPSSRRLLAFACLTALLTIFGFIFLMPRPQAQSQAAPQDRHLHKDWSHEKLAQEAFEWHEAQEQRRQRQQGPAAESVTRTRPITSENHDIFLIQDDGTLVNNQNFFDLGGRSVLFTPSGTSYTLSAPSVAFDTNFGTKLDLTAAPAVNPKTDPSVELGDDAYIPQDIGFNFTYFGAAYSTVYVTSNGNLVFKTASAGSGFDLDAVDSSNSLTTFRTGSPRIAPYWHDLDARAASTAGASGIYLRRASDRVVITYNNIRDFPNNSTADNGLHTFQATLFSDGRILFAYQSVQLTTNGLVGISPGNSAQTTSLADLSAPPATAFSGPVAEYFSTTFKVDEVGAIQSFYDGHPGRDEWDFVYFMTDFDYDLGGGAFAYYAPLRNNVTGNGDLAFNPPASQTFGSTRVQGFLNLSNVVGQYPEYPTTRFLGANSALSVMGQEQGHRWLAYVKYPGSPNLLLGRDNEHWSFFLNLESTISHPAARRSSSSEGNVWRDHGNGTFTSVNLIDGYSRLDQYLMGLRPASDVPDTFIITGASAPGYTRTSGPRPNVTATGTRQNVTVNQIIQANGTRTPDSTVAPKQFRVAVILLTRNTPTLTTLNKVARYRLAWESYFTQSTDMLGTLSTAVNDPNPTRFIAAVSAADYGNVLTPGGIASVFGQGMTSGGTAVAATQPLPVTLAGTQVLIDGTPAPLLYASPTQINFEVPTTAAATTPSLGVQSGTVTIEVVSGGQLVRAGAIQLAPALPKLFAVNQQGTGSAAALDAVTFAPSPFNAVQTLGATAGQPNIIALFATGLGADATDVDGNVNGSVTVTFNGQPATVQYAGRAPGYAGLNQINFVLPAGVSAGTYPVVVTRNGFASNTATITIK